MSIALFSPTTLLSPSSTPEDLKLGTAILQNCGVRWGRRLSRDLTYEPDLRYERQVRRFVDRTLADPRWLGDGLEFDRL